MATMNNDNHNAHNTDTPTPSNTMLPPLIPLMPAERMMITFSMKEMKRELL
jgi:hypothetical protein